MINIKEKFGIIIWWIINYSWKDRSIYVCIIQHNNRIIIGGCFQSITNHITELKRLKENLEFIKLMIYSYQPDIK